MEAPRARPRSLPLVAFNVPALPGPPPVPLSAPPMHVSPPGAARPAVPLKAGRVVGRLEYDLDHRDVGERRAFIRHCKAAAHYPYPPPH